VVLLTGTCLRWPNSGWCAVLSQAPAGKGAQLSEVSLQIIDSPLLPAPSLRDFTLPTPPQRLGSPPVDRIPIARRRLHRFHDRCSDLARPRQQPAEFYFSPGVRSVACRSAGFRSRGDHGREAVWRELATSQIPSSSTPRPSIDLIQRIVGFLRGCCPVVPWVRRGPCLRCWPEIGNPRPFAVGRASSPNPHFLLNATSPSRPQCLSTLKLLRVLRNSLPALPSPQLA
jgi:hypothetical protein